MIVIPLKTYAATDFEIAGKLVALPTPIAITDKGTLEFDKAKWKVEREGDGTELFTAKTGIEVRLAAMRDTGGSLESVTTYQLKSGEAKDKPESAASVFFSKGKLAAYVTCEDSAEKDSIGRICVTATPKLCQGLRAGNGVAPDALKELESYEMKALAVILTLRGADHQLENVVRSGNRLGLKTALQTTKGQLIALAKQIAKETEKKDSKSPASVDAKSDSAAEEKLVAERAAEDSKMARGVLEKSLPRLKQACSDTKF